MSANFSHGQLRIEVAKKPYARRRLIRVRAAGTDDQPAPDETRESPWRRLMQWIRQWPRGERPSSALATR